MAELILGQTTAGALTPVKVTSDGSLAVGTQSSAGKTVIAGTGAEEDTWVSGAAILNSTAITTFRAASTGGRRNYATDVIISNENTAATLVQLRSGTTLFGQPVLVPAGATVVINLSTPYRGEANTTLSAALDAALPANVRISATGYVGV